MSIPTGAIVNNAVSLVKGVKNPSLSNVAAVAKSAVQATGSANSTSVVTNAASLTGQALSLLDSGTPLAGRNVINSATRLAQGYLDPNTSGTVGQILGGVNQLFGLFGGGAGFGGAKPIALHSDSLAGQSMAAAYSTGKDVVFTLVRMDSGTASEQDPTQGLDAASTNLSGTGALASNIDGLSVGGGLAGGLSGYTGKITGNPLGSISGASIGNIAPTKTQFSPQ